MESSIMKNVLTLAFVSLALIIPISQLHAKEDKELRKERQVAQKERQAQKNERNRENADATKSFREFTRNLNMEYSELQKTVDLEYEFTQVDLQAERQVKMTEVEAEYQKKWTGLLMNPGRTMNKETLKEMEKEAKAHSDELFRIKEEVAQIAHKEKMASEKLKHALLEERDTHALEEAASLGLTEKYEPIIATAIGEELTRREKQWNEREKKEIEKLHTRNLKTIQEYKNGQRLREWESKNFEEDFRLKWEEKRELHALESQLTFFNSILMQSAQGGEVNQQEIMAKFAELGKQNKLVKIKYNTIQKKNSIKRRIEKKKLQER